MWVARRLLNSRRLCFIHLPMPPSTPNPSLDPQNEFKKVPFEYTPPCLLEVTSDTLNLLWKETMERNEPKYADYSRD